MSNNLEKIETSYRAEAEEVLAQAEQELRGSVERRARDMLLTAMERVAPAAAREELVSVVPVADEETKALLVGRSAEPRVREQIDRIIEADPDIEELLNTITIQMGPKVMLAAKIRMRSGLTIDEAVAHINELERTLKRALPELGWCFVEPDSTD